MSRRLGRTVMNWRWWAIAPLFLLLLPIAAVAWAVEGMSGGVAKLTQTLIAWRDKK
jgi:hypothetical protein